MAERKRPGVGIDFSKRLGQSEKSACSTHLAHAREVLLEDRRDFNSAEDILFFLEGTPCPNCPSTEVWPILWGMPNGRPPPRHVVGGCYVTDDDPRWECQACQHRFGRRIGAPTVHELDGGQS